MDGFAPVAQRWRRELSIDAGIGKGCIWAKWRLVFWVRQSAKPPHWSGIP